MHNFIGQRATVFAQSDAVATIHFIVQFCVASIREQLLIESGVFKLSNIFPNCKGFEKSLTKICDAMTWYNLPA